MRLVRPDGWGWLLELPLGLKLKWSHSKDHDGVTRGWSLTLYKPMRN